MKNNKMKATALAPSNIAFIKYWGKKDAKLRIPANSSISMNLSDVYTTTTVEFDPDQYLVHRRMLWFSVRPTRPDGPDLSTVQHVLRFLEAYSIEDQDCGFDLGTAFGDRNQSWSSSSTFAGTMIFNFERGDGVDLLGDIPLQLLSRIIDQRSIGQNPQLPRV